MRGYAGNFAEKIISTPPMPQEKDRVPRKFFVKINN